MTFTFEYFKNITNESKTNKFRVKSGFIYDVGKRYILKFKNGYESIVYIEKIYFISNKRKGLNEVLFISEKTTRAHTLTVGKINKIIKEIIEL